MAKNDPGGADVFNHGGTDLAGERALGRLVAVLGGDVDAGVQVLPGVAEVGGGRGDDHV